MQIRIQKLTFDAIIGILPHERETPQNVVVSLRLDYDYDGESFINYADVCDFIEHDMQNSCYSLLEDALESLCEKIKMNHPAITKMRLKILKPDILPNATVGLILEKTF